MQVTPSGKSRVVKTQMVRPTYRVDLSALFEKLAQNMTPPGEQEDKVQQEKLQFGGGGADPAQKPGMAAKPGAGAPGQPQPGQAQPGQPGMGGGAGVPSPDQHQQQMQKEKQRVKAIKDKGVVELNKLHQWLYDSQIPHKYDRPKLTITATVDPEIYVKSEGRWYSAKEYMQVFDDHCAKLGIGCVADYQAISPSERTIGHSGDHGSKSNKKVIYTFTVNTDGGEAGKGEQQPMEVERPPSPEPPGSMKQGTPGKQRPNSRMGQPPEKQKPDAESMFRQSIPDDTLGMEMGDLGTGQMDAHEPQTTHEIFASNKDALIKTLLKILGEKK